MSLIAFGAALPYPKIPGKTVFLFLWQLLYVIPLVLWFRGRRYWGLLKGVIIGAVLTALVNGTCYLSFFRSN